jgi:hypothetical protein
MKQQISREELSEIIDRELLAFVGHPNTEKTRQAIFDLILSLVQRFPDHIDVIQEIIQEGMKNGNASKT